MHFVKQLFRSNKLRLKILRRTNNFRENFKRTPSFTLFLYKKVSLKIISFTGMTFKPDMLHEFVSHVIKEIQVFQLILQFFVTYFCSDIKMNFVI